MSCRTTSGGSVSTTLARVVTGLSDQEVQHIFHALKREGADLPPPSEWELHQWRERQNGLLDRARRMSDTKRDGLRNKLFRSRSEPTPDGGTFYAWSRVEARARQEVAIRSIPDAIDLAPPGSQRDQYELDEQGLPAKVWYASYGSNLHRDRLLTYIKGGRPEGSSRFYEGCRDQSIPEDDIAIRIPGARPHFALTSRVWRGGIAFIDAHKGETATGLGRAYTLTREQFEDVVAQENGLLAGMCADIPYADVLDTGRVVTGTGPYETLLHIGDHNGAPVLTFTAPFSTRDALGRKGQVTRAGVRMPVLTNKPSQAYLRMIGSGLAETFGMDEVAQADYLRGCPGGDRWSRQELVRILRGENVYSGTSGTAWSRAWDNSGYQPTTSTRTVSAGRSGTGWPTADEADADTDTFSGTINYTKRATDPNPPAQGAAGSQPAHSQKASQEPAQKQKSRAQAAPEDRRVATPPDMPDVNPSTRGQFAGVKTYDSKTEQANGIRRWNSALRQAREHRNVTERLLNNMYASGTEDGDREDALRRRYEDACRAVHELNAKVRYAKNQQPANWYGPQRRPAVSWQYEISVLDAQRRDLARQVVHDERLLSLGPEAPANQFGADVKRQRAVDRARARIEALTDQIVEARQRQIADNPELA